MAEEVRPSIVVEDQLQLPGRGEYQAIIDSHTHYVESLTRPPRRGIIRADEQPFHFSTRSRNQTRVSAGQNEVVTTLVETEFEYEHKDKYGSCFCFLLIALMLLTYSVARHLEIPLLQLVKYFSCLWIAACALLLITIYAIKAFITSRHLKSLQQTPAVEDVESNGTWPCLLATRHHRHTCHRATEEELIFAYRYGPPSYAHGLTCPIAFIECVPSPPPKYHTACPNGSSSRPPADTPPPPYLELEEENCVARDRMLEEHHRELEAEYRRHFEDDYDDDSQNYPRYDTSPTLIYYEDDEIDELEDAEEDHIRPPSYHEEEDDGDYDADDDEDD